MALINEKYRKSVRYNLLGIFVVGILFYIIFFSMLGMLTGHGKELKMPVLLNKNLDEAVKMLKSQGFDIEVDSAFDMKKNPGVVLAQMPDTGSLVKTGRTIFLTVNKAQAPATPMPDLTGVSYRSAEIVLKSSKLRLGDTVHRPDIADGAILEVLYKGKPVQAGDMIPQGSSLTLVIGDGLGNVEFDVPNVVGMTYAEGATLLNASGLQFFDLWEEPITDSTTAVIYYQYPDAVNEAGGKNKIKEGQLIDIKIRQNGPAPGTQQPVKKSNPGNKQSTRPVSDNNGDWN